MNEFEKNIQKANQDRIGAIRSNFSDELEKGRSLPIGTIRDRPNGKFIKTANGWKYHGKKDSSRSTSSVKKKDPIINSNVHKNHNYQVQRVVDKFERGKQKLLDEGYSKEHSFFKKLVGQQTKFITQSKVLREHLDRSGHSNIELLFNNRIDIEYKESSVIVGMSAGNLRNEYPNFSEYRNQYREDNPNKPSRYGTVYAWSKSFNEIVDKFKASTNGYSESNGNYYTNMNL